MVILSFGSIKAKRDTGTTIPISRCRTLPSDLRHPDLYAILVISFIFSNKIRIFACYADGKGMEI